MDYANMLRERFVDTKGHKDLYKIWKNCVSLFNEMDKELVNCRRFGRPSAKYLELESKLSASIDQFDQLVTFSKLLY
jgi:hypothetical protein